MTKATPIVIRDFSRGRITRYSANDFLAPPNSVSNSVNVNYDTLIGSGTVRSGTTIMGSTSVAAGMSPLGLTEFFTSGSTNTQIGVFTGTSTAFLYYYNTTWNTSTLTTLNNSAKVRFDQLGGREFLVNGVDAMKSSSDANVWTTSSSIVGVFPSLILKTKSRLLVAGDPTYKDRVYFSSIVDTSTDPIITWSTSPTVGDWIDINPGDGSNITGFAEVSSQVMVFKGAGLYRLDVVSKTVDTKSIYDVGAVSQEAITTCRGRTYFYSGVDINRTDGGYPEQISRLGVQDFIDAIPQANWASVASGNDGLNVYFSIGNVTLNTSKDNQRTYTNVVLKFSTRDETWSVHSYAQTPRRYSNFTSTDGRYMTSADTLGFVQRVNLGTTDNTTPIYFELETQDQEFGNRSHTKSFNNLISIYTTNGGPSNLQIQVDNGDWNTVALNITSPVMNTDQIRFSGHFFTFKWFGHSSGTAPVLDGIYLEDVIDEGIIKT